MIKQIILPEDAPFSPEQREWLNGYLSALLAPFGKAEKEDGIPVTIAWGSQTGTAETLAKKFAKLAAKSGVVPTVIDIASLDQSALLELKHLVLITSTYGDGEPPDNAQDFYNFIHSNEAPKLTELSYSILGLGDSTYPDFCQCAIDFDKRFKELGAAAMTPRVDMDVDYDDDYAQWTDDILAIFGAVSPEGKEEDDDGYTKKNPYEAEISKAYNLNSEESERVTTHVEISLKNSGLTYEVGDALGVYPINDEALVDDLIKVLGFKTSDVVDEKTLKECCLTEYEIRNITLPLVKAWAEKSGSDQLKNFIVDDQRDALNDYLWGREIIDLVKEHPIDFQTPEEFIVMLKPLAARLYSIASSPKAHEEEVHLTIGTVAYEAYGRERKGVCSTYFSERADLAKPRVFVHENKAFRLPKDDSVPMIMVGPGTGIAPFRAFLEEREACAAKGKNWLFFGNPYEEQDFLYREELISLQEKGYLHKFSTAFSRDQAEKIYVQDRMRENGAELFAWLEDGGHFYVCGDASRMAKDVDKALHEVIAVHGKFSSSEAIMYVTNLKKSKRYCRDVY